jgi:ankyrin repeat protein
MDFDALASLIRNGRTKELQGALEDSHRFDVNVRQELTGNTLLHISCQNGSKLAVKACLRMGANLNAQNSKGYTPCHFAFLYGFKELAEYCISKGADDSLRSADGRTCYECLRGFVE